MIVNRMLGATTIGTQAAEGALITSVPAPYAGNCSALQCCAVVEIDTNTPLTSWLPVPKGSIVQNAWLDPVIGATNGFTISLGNETGGNTDYGTIVVPAASGTARIQATGANVAQAYSGTTGNSLRIGLSAAPSLAAASAEEEGEELKKKDKPKPHHNAEEKSKEKPKEKEPLPESKPDTGDESPGVPLHGGVPSAYQTEQAVKPNGALKAAPAPLVTATVSVLNQPLNNTTDTLVVINNAHPEVGPGTVLQCQSEQMIVTSVVNANNFYVTRAANGTTIAAHTAGLVVVINAPVPMITFLGYLNIQYVMA
jgi:hypothetical protein